tara:strand:- start:181 stop:1284 length:1104 start_codon:yes stop_codon:yes gene_type:complete
MSINITPPNETLNLIGHEAFETEFSNLWSQGNLPHAFLFTGQLGIGKATLAYRIARYIFNQNRPLKGNISVLNETIIPLRATNINSDSKTAASRKVINQSHPNLFVIERTTSEQTKKIRQNIILDDVKGLDNFLRLTPNEDGWRIIIIDTVDDMNINTANNILKLLEEPPQNVLFLLISNRPGRLLPTIRSRCRTVTLNPLNIENIKQILNCLTTSYSEPEIADACELSEGSVSKAIQILTEVELDSIRKIVDLLKQGSGVDRNILEELSNKWLKRGKQPEIDQFYKTLDFILSWVSKHLRYIAKNGRSFDEDTPKDIKCVQALIDRIGMDNLCERIVNAKNILDRSRNLNLDKKQIIFSVITTIAD